MLSLKESVSKSITKKADFKEVESIMIALQNKADSD